MSLFPVDNRGLIYSQGEGDLDLPWRRVLDALVAWPMLCYDCDVVFRFKQGDCGLETDYAGAGAAVSLYFRLYEGVKARGLGKRMDIPYDYDMLCHA